MDSETHLRPSYPVSGNESNPETVIRLPPNVSVAGQVGTTGRQGREPDASNTVVGNTHGTTGRRERKRRNTTSGKFVRVPNAYGRYPFSALALDYLSALRDHRAALTLEQLRRDLLTINEDVRTLFEQRKLSTTNPMNLSVDDIGALLGFWRTRRKRGKGDTDGTLSATSQVHLFRALKGFLAFCGNGAVGQLKMRPQFRIPKTTPRPPQTLSHKQLEAIRIASEGYDGWWGAVARFIVRFCPATGLRPKELRLQELPCIDLGNQTILVCHPKGEGSWAEPHTETAPIAGDGVLALRDFLDEREKFLAGETHEALIPFRRADGKFGYWSEGMMRKLKGQIEKRAKVKFHLKTFRATFGQMAIDANAPLDAVSVSMRHRTTQTTERFYARKGTKQAHAEVIAALAVHGG